MFKDYQIVGKWHFQNFPRKKQATLPGTWLPWQTAPKIGLPPSLGGRVPVVQLPPLVGRITPKRLIIKTAISRFIHRGREMSRYAPFNSELGFPVNLVYLASHYIPPSLETSTVYWSRIMPRAARTLNQGMVLNRSGTLSTIGIT